MAIGVTFPAAAAVDDLLLPENSCGSVPAGFPLAARNTPGGTTTREVWLDSEVTMARGYLNSIYITFFSIAFKLFFASLAAYAFAKIDFRAGRYLHDLPVHHDDPHRSDPDPPVHALQSWAVQLRWAIILPNWFCSRRRVHAAPVLYGPAQ